jgi:hypothetical protein
MPTMARSRNAFNTLFFIIFGVYSISRFKIQDLKFGRRFDRLNGL